MNEYILSTNDQCRRTENLKQLRNSKILLFVMGLIVIALTILGIKRLFPVQIDSLNSLLDDTTLINLILSVCIVIFTVILYLGIAENLYYKHFLLKACGISTKSSLWVINWSIDGFEGEICEIKVLSVEENYFTVDKTLFKCNVMERGKKYTTILPGGDIYFSESDAVSVVDFIRDVNDKVLKSYYPEWKQDIDFVRFVQKKQTERIRGHAWSDYGHCCLKPIYKNCLGFYDEPPYEDLVKSSCKSLIILTPIVINKIKYEPFFFYHDVTKTNTEQIETIFEDFIEEKEERKRSAKKTQRLIDKIHLIASEE